MIESNERVGTTRALVAVGSTAGLAGVFIVSVFSQPLVKVGDQVWSTRPTRVSKGCELSPDLRQVVMLPVEQHPWNLTNRLHRSVKSPNRCPVRQGLAATIGACPGDGVGASSKDWLWRDAHPRYALCRLTKKVSHSHLGEMRDRHQSGTTARRVRKQQA